MPVFISYSHADVAFAEKLALQLVLARAQVWIDRWELNVGDSLIRRVEEAVAGASALVVVLSKASISSEWCRKELSGGLLRELDEKRVVVMPVLIEDCDIPLFLREKKYADFRTDFDQGLAALTQAISRVTNDTRGRTEEPDWHTDWAVDWGLEDDRAFYNFTFVEQAVGKPYSCLVTIRVRGNNAATKRYLVYQQAGLDWVYRHIITETIAETARNLDVRLVLGDPFPVRRKFGSRDQKLGIEWEATVEGRLLGDDTGFDALIDVAGLMSAAVAHSRASARTPTPEELAKLQQILGTLRPQ